MRNFSKQAKEDYSLVKDAVKTGNPRAFNELMMRHRDPIYFRILEMVNGDKELAKELTIEALERLLIRFICMFPTMPLVLGHPLHAII